MAQQQQQHQQLYSGITSGKANASVQIDVLPSGDGDDEYDYGDARVDSANVDVNAASTLARKREEGEYCIALHAIDVSYKPVVDARESCMSRGRTLIRTQVAASTPSGANKLRQYLPAAH